MLLVGVRVRVGVEPPQRRQRAARLLDARERAPAAAAALEERRVRLGAAVLQRERVAARLVERHERKRGAAAGVERGGVGQAELKELAPERLVTERWPRWLVRFGLRAFL